MQFFATFKSLPKDQMLATLCTVGKNVGNKRRLVECTILFSPSVHSKVCYSRDQWAQSAITWADADTYHYAQDKWHTNHLALWSLLAFQFETSWQKRRGKLFMKLRPTYCGEKWKCAAAAAAWNFC